MKDDLAVLTQFELSSDDLQTIEAQSGSIKFGQRKLMENGPTRYAQIRPARRSEH